MKKTKVLALVSLFVLTSCNGDNNNASMNTFTSETGTTEQSATEEETTTDNLEKTDKIRIVSYNVENLFDTQDDPNTEDEEFTSNGKYMWDKEKYQNKLDNIAKAIVAAGGTEAPAIIGLCEIENKTVLKDLINRKRMRDLGYQIVHKDSPDPRGIDVALLYQKDKVAVVSQKWAKVKLPDNVKTRDILYAKCKLANGQILHVFVNHWPSMRDGEEQSNYKREAAAKTVKAMTDSIQNLDSNAEIVMIGDFNSTPEKESLTKTLGVNNEINNTKSTKLYNLMAQYANNRDMGTHKYSGEWNVLDQIIVSGSLLDEKNKAYTTKKSANICQESFLLYQNKKGYYYPKRTFKGTNFEKGYSDHLPVTLDIYEK